MRKTALLVLLALTLTASFSLVSENVPAPQNEKDAPPHPAPLQGEVKDDSPKAQREANKASVLKQLEQLFKNSPKPIVPENLTVPQKPYVSVIEGKDGRATVIYRCRFVKSKTIVDPMESIVSSSGTVEDSPDQNIVVINDGKDKAEEIKSALLALDIQLPQILVEAQVIEIAMEQDTEKDVKMKYTKYDAEKGITSTYGYDLTPPTTNSAMKTSDGMSFYPYSTGAAGSSYKQFNLAVNLLGLSRDAKVLSSPNMLVDLGTTASMITGQDIPIQSTSVTSGTVTTSTTFKRVGVKLNVTPTLINKDIVQLEVNPEVSSISSYQTFSQSGVEVKTPVISVRNIKSRLAAGDGQIITLGGLYYSEKVVEENKVPFFGDIPYLGEAFNSRYETNVDKQLIFFLKIHILQSADSVLLDPEAKATETRTIGKAIRQSDGVFPNKIHSSLPENFVDKLDRTLDEMSDGVDPQSKEPAVK